MLWLPYPGVGLHYTVKHNVAVLKQILEAVSGWVTLELVLLYEVDGVAFEWIFPLRTPKVAA